MTELKSDVDKVAMKLIKFMKATHVLPLQPPKNEEERRSQTTYNILNNTVAGTGAVQVEFLLQ